MGLSLEKAWLKAFGKFGTERKTISQFVFQCWYIQSKLNKQKNFRIMWKKLTGKYWLGPLLKQPILSRWGYPLGTCCKVFYEYNDWQIEDTGVNWMVTRKPNPSFVLHFFNLKDARNYIQNQEVA